MSWQTQLTNKIRRLRQRKITTERETDGELPPCKIAILGVGQVLRGDDGAGVMVARGLAEQLDTPDSVLVLDAGASPENNTGPVRRFRPDLILLVDAANMHEPPGTVRLLDWQDTVGLSASTHTLPPHVLAQYLTATIDCTVALIGIQPANSALGAPLSPEVGLAVRKVIESLAKLV